MKSKQPEALRLADELERDKWHGPAVVMQAAADELRRLDSENEALQSELLELRNLKIRPPLSDLELAVLGVKFFGNPIPQGWYKAARALEAAHGILWSER